MKETKRMSAAQRRARKRKLRNRRIAMTLALVLVVALASIGGTIAWLTATTGSVVNTFTVGDVSISLTETNATADGNGNATKNYVFVPGDTLAKDPKVTVTAGSEACYLFIHVAEANNTVTVDDKSVSVISWAVRTGTETSPEWKAVTDHPGYYYREVDASNSAEDISYYILNGGSNGQVTVSDQVTKDMVAELKASKPTLTFTAAAVQKDNVGNVNAAWEKLPSEFTGASTGD